LTGKLVSRFPTHHQSCKCKTSLTGEMLALENMWRKNTRTVAFQHERTNVYSICYFGYL